MKTNVHYILLTALRDWLFIGLLIGLGAAVMIADVMGGMAMVEQEQLKVVYAAAASRLILVIGLIVFVCFHVRSTFDTKEIDVFLSRPMSRASLVLAYWIGFSVVSLLLVIPTIMTIGWVGPLDQGGFVVWGLTLAAEILLVVAVALFTAFTLKSAVSSVMASLGFYVLSRMMGFFLATSNSALLFQSKEINAASRLVMEYLAMFVPRLDFFAKTEWLVYGAMESAALWLPILQTLIFIPLLLAATVVDFRRKQF